MSRFGSNPAFSQHATSRRNVATVVLGVMSFAPGFEGLAETKFLIQFLPSKSFSMAVKLSVSSVLALACATLRKPFGVW